MDLIALLSQESVIEKEQKKRHKFVPGSAGTGGGGDPGAQDQGASVFRNKDIYISNTTATPPIRSTRTNSSSSTTS